MVFHLHKGIIALDIDGTLTAEAHTVHRDVSYYLSTLVEEGWKLIFITGRPFEWSYGTLKSFKFPYFLAVQNGAAILEMPTRRVVDRRCLNRHLLPLMEQICQAEYTDFIVYSGYDNQDWCYFRPTHFNLELLAYMRQRTKALGEKWQPIPSFKDLPLSQFSSLKCFSDPEQANRLSQRIETDLKLHAPVNRDPFDSRYCVVQATHPEATKGMVLRHYKHLLGLVGPVIAAGDDYNDESMLHVADIKVVMADAPKSLQGIADIIAPSARENGLILGLQKAVNKTQHITH